MDSYNYRKGGRTDEEFKRSLLTPDEKYVKDFIKSMKDRGKHDRYTYSDWGNKYKEVDTTGEHHLKYNKPDFLLYHKKDHTPKNDWVAPLEVCTSTGVLETYHICQHKIRFYLGILLDKETKNIVTRECYILFVNNTSSIGNEEYVLLTPKILKEFSQRKLVSCFRNKSGYPFNHNEVEWKSFNGRTKQRELNMKDEQLIDISNIMKTIKPDTYFFKIESSNYELLERMREEVLMTSRYK